MVKIFGLQLAALGVTGALAAGPALAVAGPAGVASAAGAVTAGTTSATALAQGKVVSRITLSIREEPTSDSGYLGGLPPGTIISLHCKAHGQNVDGNDLWYLLGGPRPGWVAARYVQNLSPVHHCE
jgi:hypothetical protein